jgi:hypothetical protein
VGLKFTWTLQEVPVETLVHEVPKIEKSPGLADAGSIAIELNVTVAVPAFNTVNALGVPTFTFKGENTKALGLKVNVCVAACPIPLNVTVWGLPVASSVIRSDAVRRPFDNGLNVTPT